MEVASRGYKRQDPLKMAWLNLWVCITTNDIQEFYNALNGGKPKKIRESENHPTWDEVNKIKTMNKRKDKWQV